MTDHPGTDAAPCGEQRDPAGGATAALADGFYLGDAWPDWWADMVSTNIAVTHKIDGRHRGGPDHAFVVVDGAIQCFRRGEYIARPKPEPSDGYVTLRAKTLPLGPGWKEGEAICIETGLKGCTYVSTALLV